MYFLTLLLHEMAFYYDTLILALEVCINLNYWPITTHIYSVFYMRFLFTVEQQSSSGGGPATWEHFPMEGLTHYYTYLFSFLHEVSFTWSNRAVVVVYKPPGDNCMLLRVCSLDLFQLEHIATITIWVT